MRMTTFIQYSRLWPCVWAGVSGASISNFRSYHPLIVCLKELRSTPHPCWPILCGKTHPVCLLLFSPLNPFFLKSTCLTMCCLFNASIILSLTQVTCRFFIPSPLFSSFLSSVTCFFFFHGHFHHINSPHHPSVPLFFPDNHRGPTRTRGRRQDSQSNRSSDQRALYIATVTPK